MEEQQETSFWIPLEREILTEIQLSICDLIIEGSTDQGIINKFDLKSKGNIGTCMRSTISGNIWSPGRITGGPNGYLSDVEKCLFVKLVNDRGKDMDCIKTIEAVQIAYNCRELRNIRSQEISQRLMPQCSPSKSIMRLVKSLDVYVPSESWLTHFYQTHNINIKNPITLEAARRKYYNVGAIRNFFQSHQELLINTCSFLIWNAD